MGTSTSWIAVEGATLEQLATQLSGPSWEAAILPGGWALAIARMQRDGLVAEPDLLARLSRDRRVVACDEESHVMYAASAEWRDGRERWAVIHSSEKAADHLVARGDLPGGWISIRDEHLAKREDGVDHVYEIPLDIAKLVVGAQAVVEALVAPAQTLWTVPR